VIPPPAVRDPAHPAPHVVLASASPRRRELLALIGIAHEVRPADVDESIPPGEPPAVHAERLARSKAEAVGRGDPAAIVIAADTIVVIDDDILGKPRDAAEATKMLRRLSGRTHTVYTGVAVRRAATTVSAVEHVAVTFRPLTDERIASYIATGEPMDKAGAYGIQGFGATIVERIDGDYFAVMGLAVGTMVELMTQVGVRYEFGRLTVDLG
jgi:septum formation protein